MRNECTYSDIIKDMLTDQSQALVVSFTRIGGHAMTCGSARVRGVEDIPVSDNSVWNMTNCNIRGQSTRKAGAAAT